MFGWAPVDKPLSSPSCERLGEGSGVWNGVEFELDVVDRVKTDDGSGLGGVAIVGMMSGVPGCLNGVTVFPLGL